VFCIIPTKTAVISLNRINRLAFVIKTVGVYCEVGTVGLNICCVKFIKFVLSKEKATLATISKFLHKSATQIQN